MELEREKEKLLENKRIWYSRIFVLFEIVKCLKNRELSFIAKKEESGIKRARYFIAQTIEFLKKHFDRVEFDKSLANIYQSVAQLKDIPVFSYNFRKRTKSEEWNEFNKNFEKHVIGYDFFLDFDGKKNFERCHKETQEMKEVFDEYKIPYWIMNSSSNGFHIHIPAEYMPEKEIKQSLEELNLVLKNIKLIYDFETLDEMVIDMKRICKVPYSFVDDGTVCLPLTDSQIKLFDKKRVEAIEVLRTIKIKDRGVLLRTHNLSDDKLKENVKNFLEEFI